MVNLGPEFWDPAYTAEQSALDAKLKAAKDATPKCAICEREPQDIPDYVIQAEFEGVSPTSWAKSDGTYSPEHNKFTCDECYARLNMPTTKHLIERYYV